MRAHHAISEWGYLHISGENGSERSITRAQADQLLAIAEVSARTLGGTADSILTDGRHRLRAGQVVGIVASRDVTLEILPKVDSVDEGRAREVLVRMLARTLDLPVASGALTQIDWQRHDLLEIVIGLFCRSLFKAVHQGLPRAYVSYEEDLTRLRGRLDVVRQFTSLAASPQRLACRYEELSIDVPLNQIMKAGILKLRKVARSTQNQRYLAELAVAYADVTTVGVDRLPWARILLDRTNTAWASLLNLARLILGDRFQTTSFGSGLGFSLLFEMNTLFEEFVGRTLQTIVNEGRRVVRQGPRRFALVDRAVGRSCFATVPDISVHGPGGVELILDTKWKRLSVALDDPRHGVAQSDVYQMMAYSQAYRCREVMLLYPHSDGRRGPGVQSEFVIVGSGDARLSISTVDISKIDDIPEQLSTLLNWIASSAPGSRAVG